jgi:hypothetical protein
MSRGVLAAVALALIVAPAADAAPRKNVAATKSATKAKKSKTKVATKTTRTKTRRGVRVSKLANHASTKGKPRVKTSAKPLVKVAELQSDGRVKYGPDRLPPGFAWPPTAAMVEAGKACEAELDTLGVKWKPAGPQDGMVANPVIVPTMEIGGIAYTSAFRRKTPPPIECQFVRVLALIGPELHRVGVREVQFGSIVRNTLARSHGQTKDFMSRHALGIAMDIKSFVDANGRVAVVESDYLKDDPLLHSIEELINASTRFRQVLTPGNDPISHDDHFHIEASVDFTAFR